MKHFIAMSSTGGLTLADHCSVHHTAQEASETLAELFELDSEDSSELLQERKFVHHGYDLAYLLEIVECNCSEPHIHQDEYSDPAEFYREFDPLVVNGKYKAVTNVAEIDCYPEFAFNVDSQDVEAVKDYLGKAAQDYDSFFALAENGDYVVVYGMVGIVPTLNKALDLVWPVYPRDYNQELDALMLTINKREYKDNMCSRCRLVHSHQASCTIPDAPCYVLANDKFMSNWAGIGKNVIVVPCADYSEAEKVYNWINHNRTDQKYVRIVTNKPAPKNRKLSLMLEWRYRAINRSKPKPESETK